MAGFGNGTRRYPRTRGRMRSRSGPDRATLGIIGTICAVAGFFTLGIVLGPAAMICGWLAMNRTWSGSRPLPAVIALILGAIDTLLALILLTSTTPTGFGPF
ncbi:small hydrophobic protein [Streptomyces sp. NPDC000983]|uniref:small hydrophobic protein n=1 Tax=Streptomyces sp. NPDC000983 TaxID=3154373 RepID=UPI0033246DEA